MKPNPKINTFLALAIGVTMAVSPALAQGKGNRPEKKEKPRVTRVQEQRPVRPELRRRDTNDVRWEDRRDTRRGNGAGKVPPGWCKGKGNPHNTPENCGHYDRDGRYDSRDPSRYPDRYPTPYPDRYPDRDGRYDSYEQAHAAFHRQLDAEYSARAAERPFDIRYQVQLRAEKKAEHDRWHQRYGRTHR